jgi:hypothetical protein
MAKSAEGIVSHVNKFTGVVRIREVLRFLLLDESDEVLPNVNCKVKFKDGKISEIKSDSNGILEFPRRAQGEIEIEVLEEDAVDSEGEV